MGDYWATSARVDVPAVVPEPLFATATAPSVGSVGAVVGVAYVTLTVHVSPAASGVANEQVVPVRLNRPARLRDRVSVVILRDPAPELVMVTTLVTGARGVGIENVSVRMPRTVVRVPFVAAVKLNVPGVIPVPVSVTGVPVTVAPV